MHTHAAALSGRDSAKLAIRAEALTECEVAERHAAVCAGAVMYSPDLKAFANGMSANRHQADDLVQSTILRALDASHQFTPGTNFRAWTFTILRNVFYSQWRSPASRLESIEDCLHNMPVTDPSQDRVLELCDLRRALAQLGPEQRQALLLVVVSGLDYEAVAEISGVAKGTVKSRVSRARANLRTLMDGGHFKLSRREVGPISALDFVSV
jgi:RNA polymerase sigma-70 factor (ECF subfamily)